MSARRIDGAALAARLRAKVQAEVAAIERRTGTAPGLAVVLLGDDPASRVYVASKARQTVQVGMRSIEHRLVADTREAELLALIASLNRDPAVHGILVQLPLPAHIRETTVLGAIDPDKDVDGFHPLNAGRLATGTPGLVPCTPLGCVLLARAALPELAGLEAVVLGRSNIVGKPLAQLLLREHCTVTIAHSRSRDLPTIARRADLLVAAVGQPALVTANWVKPGATVIDVGINRILRADGTSHLVGDVDTDAVARVASAVTPVPGGVGPMTIACLLANTVRAACRVLQLPEPDLDPSPS
jgi:methylenetetrahydrofolate dehydrogenase (NADP+)/methenyltetrahydrofolate cyclohydrolase